MGLATAATIASIGLSAKQFLDGARAQSNANKAAQDAANTAARIAENDKFLALNVPTLGIENAQQNMQAWQQQQIQNLKDIGAAGVLGGITASGQQARAQNRELSADAQQMQYQRDMAQAQNAQQIEQGRMQREFGMNQAKLAGAQQAAAEGRQAQAVGIQGGLGALSSAATLQAYRDVNNVGGTNIGSNFLGDIGYALGLGGTNSTPVSETTFMAQEALKPTIQGMAPSVAPVAIKNPGTVTARENMRQQQQLDALRNPQAQFDSQYRWNPYTGQWGLR
jgi:hypothetical protein